MSEPVVTFITGALNAIKSCSQVVREEKHPILEYSRIFYEEFVSRFKLQGKNHLMHNIRCSKNQGLNWIKAVENTIFNAATCETTVAGLLAGDCVDVE
jgi:hypothetical protein